MDPKKDIKTESKQSRNNLAVVQLLYGIHSLIVELGIKLNSKTLSKPKLNSQKPFSFPFIRYEPFYIYIKIHLKIETNILWLLKHLTLIKPYRQISNYLFSFAKR